MPLLERKGKPSIHYVVDDHTDPWRKAPTILLQHGYGRSTEFWRGWVPYLSRFYRVVRADLRGFGQSPLDFDPHREFSVREFPGRHHRGDRSGRRRPCPLLRGIPRRRLRLRPWRDGTRKAADTLGRLRAGHGAEAHTECLCLRPSHLGAGDPRHGQRVPGPRRATAPRASRPARIRGCSTGMRRRWARPARNP